MTVLAPAATDGELTPPKPPEKGGRVNVLVLENSSGSEALQRLHAAIPDTVEQLLWFDGDAPFPSLSLTSYLRELHLRSWCDYTFGDGFPTGYAPQVLRREILPVLATLAESRDLPWNRTILFDALSVDINAFDLETEAASEDYSLLRASLTVDNRADYLLCRRLVERGAAEPDLPPEGTGEHKPDPFRERFRDDRDTLLQTLLKEPALRRTLPRYYHVQVTNRFTQKPAYRPDEGATPIGDMSHGTMELVLAAIHRETPEAIVAFGYRGEPGVYPELPRLLRLLSAYRDLTCYLETSGVGWTEENLRALQESGQTVGALIVEVDAYKAETYATLRGTGREEALRFIERMRTVLPGRLYVQATRMKENEWELQDFFKHWSSLEGVKPLIQKYNNYAGRLPDRRVADLQPLRRVPCRHLERELVILLDGRVVRCHQDIDEASVRGSLQDQSLMKLWEAGSGDYLAHLEERYPALCESCDEYYTINA